MNYKASTLVAFSITVAIKVLCKVRRSHATAGIRPTITYINVIVFIGMLVFVHIITIIITKKIPIYITVFS